jgi:hypothetical protein
MEWLRERLYLYVTGPRPFFVERDNHSAVAWFRADDFNAIAPARFFAEENRHDDFVAKVYGG